MKYDFPYNEFGDKRVFPRAISNPNYSVSHYSDLPGEIIRNYMKVIKIFNAKTRIKID